jgi:DNA-directed RNA polymerase specialized sigma24 family protein
VNQLSAHQSNPLVICAMGRRFPMLSPEHRWPATIELCRAASAAQQRRLGADDPSLQVSALLEVLRIDSDDAVQESVPPVPFCVEHLDVRMRGWVTRFLGRWAGEGRDPGWDVVRDALARHDAEVASREPERAEVEAALVARFQARRVRLRAVAWRVVRRHANADEVLGQAAATLIAALGRRPDDIRAVVREGNLDAWLNRVVVNAAIDYLRRNPTHEELDLERNGGTIDDRSCQRLGPSPTIDAGPHDERALLELVDVRDPLRELVQRADGRLDALVAAGRVPVAQCAGVRDGVRAVLVNAIADVPYKSTGGFPLHALLVDVRLLEALQLGFLVITTPSGQTLHQNATRRRRTAIDQVLVVADAEGYAA